MRASAWRPMLPWAVAAVLCAPLALSLLVFGWPVVLVDARSEPNKHLALLEQDFALPREDAKLRRGVVFAISGLACAIAGPKRLPGESIDLTLLVKPAASLLEFDRLIGPAIAARPDFVIVQSTMLLLSPKKNIFWPNGKKIARAFWRRQILSLMPGLVADIPVQRQITQAPRRETLVSQCGARTKTPRAQWRDDLTRVTARFVSPEDRRRHQVRAMLRRFALAGVPVLVVTPPVNKVSAAYFARVSAELQPIVGPTPGGAGVFFLEPPRLLPDEQFSDALHIYPDQADSYRAWLSAAIVATLGS